MKLDDTYSPFGHYFGHPLWETTAYAEIGLLE
jgi:hypothetical protein